MADHPEAATSSTRDEAHTCHALACETHVPPRMHMCKRHWFMVPKPLRDGLWDAYRPGQERRMNPSPAYLLAAARCVHAVASKEGHDRTDIAEEVDLYETWANMLTDEPQDFMALIEADPMTTNRRRDRFVAGSADFHDLMCSLMQSRQRLVAEGKDWATVLREQQPCDCGVSMVAARTPPDSECITLPNGECVAPVCKLHGSLGSGSGGDR